MGQGGIGRGFTLSVRRRTFNGYRLGALAAVLIVLSFFADAASADSGYLLHNSTNLGTRYGTWGTGFDCATCHVKTGTTNIKRIRTSLDNRPVVFKQPTSSGNGTIGVLGNDERTVFAEGSRNVCEVCHHQTVYHQYSASKLASLAHTQHKSNRKDCTQCHKHRSGFKPPVLGDCNGCHGYPPVSNSAYGGPSGMLSPPTYALGGTGNTPPANVGAHDRHRNKEGMECFTCHNNYRHGFSGNDIIEIGFKINSSNWRSFTGSVTNGTFTGTISGNFASNYAAAPNNPGTTVLRSPGVTTCSIYCHGDNWQEPSGKVGGAVSWTQGPLGACANAVCHGTTQANPPTPVLFGNVSTGAHKTHVGALNAPCTTCHDDYPNPHMVNGHVKWNLSGISADAKYKGFNTNSTATLATTAPYGDCTNIYCHSNVQSDTPSPGAGPATVFKPATWGGTRFSCDGCHGGGRGDAAPMVTGAHQKHISVYSFGCGDCHSGAGKDNPARHADRTIDVELNGTYGGSYDQVINQPGDGYGSCSATYCHSDGAGSTRSVGWGDAPLGCTACHGGDATAAPNDIRTNKHGAHINNPDLGTNFGCSVCHGKTVDSNSHVSNTASHVNKMGDYSGARAGRYMSADGSCTSYCHTDGKGQQNVAFTPGTGWKSGYQFPDCKGCHGNDPAGVFTSTAGEPNYATAGINQLRSNSHDKHMGGAGATVCTYCHSQTVTASGAITGNSHADGTINVAPGSGKDFAWLKSATEKSCSNISCHGAGSAKAYWGDTFPIDCTGCHGGNAATAESGKDLKSGSHGKHINNTGEIGRNLSCDACHGATVSGDRFIRNPALHGNSFVNLSGVMSSRDKTTCITAYCHTDGKGDAGRALAWGTTTLGCDGCHGAASGTGTFVSVAGEPNYANLGGLRANGHESHTRKLVLTGAASCTICHTNTVTLAGAAIQGAFSSHLNRRIDVDFNRANEATAVWDKTLRTCSNIACHSGQNATWGDASTAGCKVCHPNLAASGAHAAHIGDLWTNNQVTMYNYTANRSYGGVYRFGCTNCHPSIEAGNHRNNRVDVTLFKGKINGGYQVTLNNLANDDQTGYTKGSGTFTCELAYCHSNGRTSPTAGVPASGTPLTAGDYRQSPNWYGGAYAGNKCGMCHDNPPQYADQSHYVAQSSLGDNGSPPYKPSGHMVGIHFDFTAKGNRQNGFLGFSSSGSAAHGNPDLTTTIGCYICHNGIVDSSRIDTYAMYDDTTSNFRCANCHTTTSRTRLQPGAISDTRLHINGRKDVAFPNGSLLLKTKAQLSNVANALGWTRHGAYKAEDAFDSFDLALSTWQPTTKTCLTACHVNQPNITWGAKLTCVSCHANQ